MSAVMIAVIGAVGVIAGGIITGFFTKKKTSAEAGKLVVDAAAGAVEILRGENTRILAEAHAARADAQLARTQADTARDEMLELRTMSRQTRDMVVAHTVWDQQVVEIAAGQGLTLPPVPPLYPQDK